MIAINVSEHVNYSLSLHRFLLISQLKNQAIHLLTPDISFFFVNQCLCFIFVSFSLHRRYNTVNMMMRQMVGVVALVTIALVLLMQIPSSTACMCMPKHSQSSYCDSDYGK